MLILGVADTLLKSISGYVGSNIRIMDAEGMVVASTDKESRGVVFSIARDLMNSVEESVVVKSGDSNNLKGIEMGAYVSLVVDHNKVGVLSVAGSDESTLSTANVVRICMEKSLELELAKHDYAYPLVSNERYIHQLLYNTRMLKEDIDYLVRITHIRADLPRVPILLVVHKNDNGPKEDAGNILKAVTASGAYSATDLLGHTLDGNVIWFKCVDPGRRLDFMSTRTTLNEEIEAFIATLNDVCFSAYIGAIQEKLQNYGMAYKQCEWMRLDICTKGIYYFYDYVLRYLGSKVSRAEYETMFAALRNCMDSATIDNFCEMMDALIQCDYNFTRVAEKLFIHKNTAIYRFDKIRNLFNMNPLINSNERIFLETLYNYMRTYPRSPEN